MTTPLDPAGVLARLGRDAVLSHETAARLHGLDLVEARGEHVTLPRDRSRRLVEGWTVHRRDVPAADLAHRDGLAVTSVPRTVADVARVLPCGEALAVAESAVRKELVALADLRAVVGAATGAWAARPRAVARLLDRSDSVLESLAAALFWQAGLPPPLRQYEVSEPDGTLVARTDFCWPSRRLVVEVDGFAFHSDRLAYRRDRDRLNALQRRGWRVLRFSYEDVRSRPQHVVVTVRACLALAG